MNEMIKILNKREDADNIIYWYKSYCLENCKINTLLKRNIDILYFILNTNMKIKDIAEENNISTNRIRQIVCSAIFRYITR